MKYDEDLEPEQIEAFEKAKDILAEHFPAFVMLCETRVESGDTVCRYTCTGSHHTALGMIEQYKHILLNRER